MKNITKIAVATDFSKESDDAIKMATQLSTSLNAKVTLIHISSMSGVWDWPSLVDKQKEEEKINIEKKLKEQVIRCEVDYPYEILFGDKDQDILTYIKHNKTDLLVMGHRRERSIFSISSLAKKIIELSPIPVIISSCPREVKKVAGLIDLTNVVDRSIEATKTMAEILNTKSLFFTAIPDLHAPAISRLSLSISANSYTPEEKASIIQNSLKELNKHTTRPHDEHRVIINNEETSIALTNAMNDEKIDMAILVKNNRGVIERFILGSTSEGILDNFKGHILVLPA